MNTFFRSFGDELEKIAAPLRAVGLRIADPKAFTEFTARSAGRAVSHTAPAAEAKALSGVMKSAPAAEASHRTIKARPAAPASAAVPAQRPASAAMPSSRSMPIPAATSKPPLSLGKKLMLGGAAAAGAGVGAGAANKLRRPEPHSSVDQAVP